MIRKAQPQDFDSIFDIINDSARAYQGVIPPDCWRVPYMTSDELREEMAAGVEFWLWCEENGKILGVMGVQPVRDVTLIRHAYVRTVVRNQGIGGKLLSYLLSQIAGPVLMGTWKAASWAASFYQKYGFELVSEEEKNRLLKTYWVIPDRQVETSVVLANQAWFEKKMGDSHF